MAFSSSERHEAVETLQGRLQQLGCIEASLKSGSLGEVVNRQRDRCLQAIGDCLSVLLPWTKLSEGSRAKLRSLQQGLGEVVTDAGIPLSVSARRLEFLEDVLPQIRSEVMGFVSDLPPGSASDPLVLPFPENRIELKAPKRQGRMRKRKGQA